MTTFGFERIGDEVILAARILLVVLFLIFGWSKLADFSGTVAYMAQTGVPAPAISALVAIAMEAFSPLPSSLASGRAQSRSFWRCTHWQPGSSATATGR
jgi:hypothetical protein